MIIFINNVFQNYKCDYLIYLKILICCESILRGGVKFDDLQFDIIRFLH